MNSIPHTSGVYQILCIPTGKVYIGSSEDLARRWSNHCTLLRGNRHDNKHLQFAWNKYGESAFEFTVIELVLVGFCLEREQYWLDKTQSYNTKCGFNLARVAGAAMSGRSHTPETKAKMSQSHTGKPLTPEHRAAVSRGQIGKIVSAETRTKMSTSKKGTKRPHSPETRAKMSAAHVGKQGRPLSSEHKAKLLARHALEWAITLPNGDEIVITNLAAFCREHNLNCSQMQKMEQQGKAHYKGYKCKCLR